jgi:beta-galactosidase
VEGGEVLARFAGGYFEGEPALIRKAYPGGGAALYLGSGFSEDGAKLILKKLGFSEPYAEMLSCPEEVELSVREKSGERWVFLLNYSDRQQIIALRRPLRDAMTGETRPAEWALPPYGVAVLKV